MNVISQVHYCIVWQSFIFLVQDTGCYFSFHFLGWLVIHIFISELIFFLMLTCKHLSSCVLCFILKKMHSQKSVWILHVNVWEHIPKISAEWKRTDVVHTLPLVILLIAAWAKKKKKKSLPEILWNNLCFISRGGKISSLAPLKPLKPK